VDRQDIAGDFELDQRLIRLCGMNERNLTKSISISLALWVLCIVNACAATPPVKTSALPSLAEVLTAALPSYTPASRASIEKSIQQSGSAGRLEAAVVNQIARSEGKSVEAFMGDLLAFAKTYSRPSLTAYRVGCVALADNGDLYLGANLEVEANVLSMSVHGEQSAISNALRLGAKRITALAVTAAPCGHCRQFLNEIEGADKLQVHVTGKPPATLRQLLPEPFGPADLGLTTAVFNSPAVALKFAPGHPAAPSKVRRKLDDLAIEAAGKSYAPYSKALSGVALRTSSGKIFWGSYIENAAFNPSLSPLQMALVGLIFGGESVENVTEVVLVELQDSAITQRRSTQSTLEALAPGAAVTTLLAVPAKSTSPASSKPQKP
jgi:cytidine deaminase